ncbi:amidase family protein [Solimonas flava]|uniref:amidase family protein n=1 Tax=Solimonas flava TaxID=415849 RepID=UPI00041A0B9D|nr:amidase family protein [Solimonas flava]
MRAALRLAAVLALAAPLPAAAESAPRDAAFVLEEATLADVQRAFAAGTLGSQQLVDAYLARIAAYDGRLHAIITVNPKARDQAAALDAERRAGRSRGPLHGIPVLLKDNIDTGDLPTSNGSAILKDSIPPDDAHIAAALRAAGAVILGKAAMGEFAGGSYNSVSGQAVNPYNARRHTGGSSSGSGAALAANFAMLAVGTDTSTSVRGPAAYNGVVGLRPTTGLISRDGIAPKNLDFDTAGPMARTVRDVAVMLGTLAFRDAADPASAPVWDEVDRRYAVKDGRVDYSAFLDTQALKGKKLGVVRDFFGSDAEIDRLAEAALAQMRKLGAQTVDIHLDPAFVAAYVGDGNRAIRRVADYRFRADWERYLATLGPQVPKTVAAFVERYETVVARSPLPVEASVMRLLKDSLKTSTDDPAYRQLIDKTLPQASADKLALFARYGVDALVFPYHASFAPPIRNPVYRIDDPDFVAAGKPEPATLAGYGAVGLPSIVVPMGFGRAGLPTGIGFLGRPYEEGALLGYAYAYEQASQQRRPPRLTPAIRMP